MDNKNEKTFADLFSSSSLMDDDTKNVTDDNITLDGLLNSVDDNDASDTKVSFNDVSSEVRVDENQIDYNSNEIGVGDLFKKTETEENVNEVESDESHDNDLVLSDLLKEETNDNSEKMDSLNNNSIFFDNYSVNEEKNVSSNDSNNSIDFDNNNLKEDVNESADNSLNLFFDNKAADVVVDDNVSLVGSDVKTEGENIGEKNLVSEQVNLGADLFFDNNNDVASNSTLEQEEVNLFLDGSDDEVKTNDFAKENNIESISEEVEANKIVEAKKEKEVVESVSPFFQDNSLDKNDFGIESLEDKKISFDQTKNVNSKLDKLELSNSKHFNVKVVQPKTSLLKFIIGVFSYAFFIFLVLILVTLLAYVLDIKVRAAKGDYSSPTFNAYVVLTGSMLPEIQVKDVVVTKKVDAEALKVGDIITFASSDSRFFGTIITHRIIKKNQDNDGNITFQTQGDNNNVADSALVQPNNIYGKVILKIPKLGYLQDFLATQGGWIIVILLPCMAVISYDIVKIAKGIKRRKNKINVIK